MLLAPELSRECRRLLVDQAKDARIERACQRAIEADPDDWASHSNLVEFYRARRCYAKAEQILRRNAARAQESEWRQVLLAEMLVLQDKTPEAEKLLWAVLGRSSDPAMVNRALMSLDGLFQARGRPDLIGEAYRQVIAFETHGMGAEARLSYRRFRRRNSRGRLSGDHGQLSTAEGDSAQARNPAGRDAISHPLRRRSAGRLPRS